MQDEDDQVFDEFYEEEDDTDDEANSLDALFDAVLDQKPTQRRSKNKENLQTLAESILTPEVERARQRRRAAMKQSNAELQTRTKQERSRVVASLRWAKTDREIWDILHREVFEKIRALDLDGKPTSLKRQRNNDGAENPQVLFSNASVLIFQAALLLRQKHAGSPFPFQIIPTLKSLGRSAYALGASTDLYNVLLRIAWAQHTSYTYLENLLTDMENGGIEFNLRTLKTLDGVLQEYRTLCRATSTTANTIFRMDLHAEGAQKVLGWRDLVKERVEREARSGKARTVQGVGVGARGMGAAASGISPRKTMMR